MTLYPLPYDPGSYRQENLIPCERRHLRLDVYLVGASDTAQVTLAVRENLMGTVVQMAAFGIPCEDAGYLALAAMLHSELQYHRGQLSPF